MEYETIISTSDVIHIKLSLTVFELLSFSTKSHTSDAKHYFVNNSVFRYMYISFRK